MQKCIYMMNQELESKVIVGHCFIYLFMYFDQNNTSTSEKTVMEWLRLLAEIDIYVFQSGSYVSKLLIV